QENIDPVRYITNHSSGKMGFALAEAAAEAGAQVTLVSGPVFLPTPDRVQRIDVVSARDMLAACEAAMPSDILIAAAAVADYRPEVVAQHKLKKDPTTGDGLYLQMVRNPDILATLAARPDRPFSVGFAAETEHLLDYAARKLKDKNLDLIVANDVANPSIGFNSEENAITVIDRQLQQTGFAQTSKGKIARQLVALIAARYTAH
uniref:phosphopantothenoylcysteine decarboxylase domain-containing protein n=1 Tax=Pseudomonas sp. TaxID=306 RepID=UPI0019F6E35A